MVVQKTISIEFLGYRKKTVGSDFKPELQSHVEILSENWVVYWANPNSTTFFMVVKGSRKVY